MRQGQQNRRGRGRNRKGQSPLARSFESTGPDVKIRGTPAHIAEKYMSLARDATSSGDPVLAENYLQHAEHYNRIIMAFRDQQMAQGGDMNGGMPRHRPFNDMEGDDFGDDDGDDGDMQPPHHHMQQPQVRHNDPQPRQEGQRFEGQRHDQNRFRDRHEHRRNHDRPERRDHGGGDPGGQQQPRQRVAESAEASGQPPAEGFQRRDRFPQQQHEQPEFLRRPVRRPRREGNGGPEVNGAGADDSDRD
jgi:hypothetical protein